MDEFYGKIGGGFFVCFIFFWYIGLIIVCICLGVCLLGERMYLFCRWGCGCFMVLSLEFIEVVILVYFYVEVWDLSVVWLEIVL